MIRSRSDRCSVKAAQAAEPIRLASAGKTSPTHTRSLCSATSLRSLAVEVFAVRRSIRARVVDNAVAMVGWRMDRVRLQGLGTRIHDVVPRARRNKHRFAAPRLDTENG